MKKRYYFFTRKWLCAGFVVIFATAFSLDASAQNGPAKQWDKTFGGSQVDEFASLQQTSDGGYILGGRSDSGINGDKTQASKGLVDFWVVKLDASGNKSWDKTFGGNADDQLNALQQTADGGYILGGWSNSGLSGDKTQVSKGGADYWVVKLDANGNKSWDRSFGSSGWDYFKAIRQTADGGYVLGGYSDSGVSGDKSQASKGIEDYWIVKLDANGNKQWDKTFGGNNQDMLLALQQTADGGYILGGHSNTGINGDKSQPSQGNQDFWIIKLDALGNKIWDKSIGGSQGEFLTSLQQTIDGGYILGGWSDSGAGGDKSQPCMGLLDYWVVKVDALGNKIWDKTFGGGFYDNLFSLQQTSDGGYILGGESSSGLGGDKTQASKGGSDYWVVKLDATGNKSWDKTIGGSNEDYLRSLIQTSDGGYLLGGTSGSFISGDKTQNSKGSGDYWIVKLAGNTTGIQESNASFAISISPNPNSGKFTLQFNNLPGSKAEVTISDLLGRVVLQQQLKGLNQVNEEITLPNSKGLYLLQVKANALTRTYKIVVE